MKTDTSDFLNVNKKQFICLRIIINTLSMNRYITKTEARESATSIFVKHNISYNEQLKFLIKFDRLPNIGDIKNGIIKQYEKETN